jgi:hypothetical protein
LLALDAGDGVGRVGPEQPSMHIGDSRELEQRPSLERLQACFFSEMQA